MTKVIAVAVALLVVASGAWLWCASGRSAMARALQSSELRADLLDARASTLDARVAIYSVNFGEASRHLEDARGLLRRADKRLNALGLTDEVKQLQTALAGIDDAQRLTGARSEREFTRGRRGEDHFRRAERCGEAITRTSPVGAVG